MNRRLPALAVVAATAVALPAAAQFVFAKTEDAIKYRQSAMFLQGQHFGRLVAMTQGKLPFDPKAATLSAEVVAMTAQIAFAGFIDGTDKGGHTRAKPEIWLDPDKFKADATKLQEQAPKLVAAAKGGSLDALKAAVGETGRTCKACHDEFRKD